MKKSILAIAASVFMTGVILTSCSTSAEKVENAKKNVEEAKNELDSANKEYLTDIENYRKETDEKIAANEKTIAALKVKTENETKATKLEHKKRIAELEQKNSDMKKKLDDYQPDGKTKWELFKADFSKGMDEIGTSLKDLTANV